jgi:hypothetical protein
LFEQAITVVANAEHLIPIKDLARHNIACLSIISENADRKKKRASSAAVTGDAQTKELSAAELFPSMLKRYAPIAHHTLVRQAITPAIADTLASKLKQYQVVIVGIHGMSTNLDGNFGLEAQELRLLESLERDTALIIVLFGSVYSLACFPTFKHIIMPYEDDPVAANVVPQVIFGTLPAKGRLPVSIPGAWEAGWSIRTEAISRPGYTLSELVNDR